MWQPHERFEKFTHPNSPLGDMSHLQPVGASDLRMRSHSQHPTMSNRLLRWRRFFHALAAEDTTHLFTLGLGSAVSRRSGSMGDGWF